MPREYVVGAPSVSEHNPAVLARVTANTVSMYGCDDTTFTYSTVSPAPDKISPTSLLLERISGEEGAYFRLSFTPSHATDQFAEFVPHLFMQIYPGKVVSTIRCHPDVAIFGELSSKIEAIHYNATTSSPNSLSPIASSMIVQASRFMAEMFEHIGQI
jgi:hypothetical protein